MAIKRILYKTNLKDVSSTIWSNSDIIQTIKSVIAKLQIAKKVGVCRCLLQMMYEMVIKFPRNPIRLTEKVIFGKTPMSAFQFISVAL